ncbi:ABC transporter permease [Streptomyces morookaense]|uniref:ABC transporter permease n=1 Tax=Streptomyces morookaense TaxID=1970 RepID=UPI00340BDAA6
MTPPERTRITAGPTGVAVWARDLAMGIRFAVTGGREAWLRTALTAVGVGLGVALLMIAASVPHMMSERHQRGAARAVDSPSVFFDKRLAHEQKPGSGTFLYKTANTDYHDKPVNGALLQADGPSAPAPPGVGAMPRPGEMVVSPALDDLLHSDNGKLLRERFEGYRTVGTIAPSGLIGPNELFYYAGSDKLAPGHGTVRVDGYGYEEPDVPLTPELFLLVIIVCVVLLMPIAVFITTAVRFGGDQRDQRLAALRLVGADAHMTRRVAAGEALCGSLFGLSAGAGLFLLLREFATYVTIRDNSVFPSDIVPEPWIAALIALAVPVCAVVVTLFTLRRIAIEPLGVVRNAVTRRRRLWWRLLIPAVGIALLLPLFRKASGYAAHSVPLDTYQIGAGTALLLVGLVALLPWAVEICVSRFRRGPLPWQLAARRLQFDSGPAARAVSGITVAVAGAIAVQMLFAGVQSDYTTSDGHDPGHFQVRASYRPGTAEETSAWTERFRATKGVEAVTGYVERYADKPGDDAAVTSIHIGDCATLQRMAHIDSCRDGDVFVAQEPGGDVDTEHRFAPGTRLTMKEYSAPAGQKERGYDWTVPASARVVTTRPDPSGDHPFGILATPSAIDVTKIPDATTTFVAQVTKGDLDAIEQFRNTAAHIDPSMRVWRLGGVVKDNNYATIEKGLLIGAVATLALIGAGMAVTTAEQLRERKRLLSVLVAFGTRRSTLGWSVLWQTIVPVVLGMALAVGGGLGLGWAMLHLLRKGVRDWWSFVPVAGTGAAVIMAITVLGLVPMWRLMRGDGLRSE